MNDFVLQEKLQEIKEMKTTNQKQGYLKAQMDFLNNEKCKIDQRLDHILNYKIKKLDIPKNKNAKPVVLNENVNYDHFQNQKVNRLIGYRDSQRDILSQLIGEE